MSKVVQTILGQFDEHEALKFKRLYSEASKKDAETFKYHGGDVLTSLAKYVVEYLTNEKLL